MEHITILSIEVINFMCHSNLKINFEKMVTCIGGRNGSGKSAVMLALGALFGQTARELDRGSSFRNLIKTGTNQAIIRVKINNHKKYKKEKYGDFILIEKKIRESYSKITVSNHLGKIFNLKKNELEMIAETYSLKFDNPLNFLTQEASKKFLNVNSAKDLYDFYYVGTEFKNIDQDLEQSNCVLDELNEKMKEATEQLNLIDITLSGYLSELKYLEYDPDANLKKLENEEKWLSIEKDQNKIQTFQEEIRTIQNEIASIEAQRAIQTTILDKVFVEKNVEDQEEEKSRLEIQHHALLKEIEEYEREKVSIEQTISQIKFKNNTDDLNKQISSINESLQNKKEQLIRLEAIKDKAFEKMQSENQENQAKSERIYNYKKQIEYLKQNAFDSFKSKEADNVKKIRQEIAKSTFRDEIIGPLHEYISLKEHKWYKVVSIIFRKSLNNFIVFNNEDKITLYGIFNKLHLDYSVSQMRTKRAYSSLKVNPEFPTLLNIIDIKHPVVSNYLITMHNIEQLVLINDRVNAHKIVLRNPKYVDSVYTPSGDKIKLVNGSLSDFRQRDDGYYWFEDKFSKIKKYEMEMNSIEISNTCKDEYSIIINQIGSISSEIDSLEKALTKLIFELEAYSNLKENDTGNLEKRLKLLNNSISLLNTKKSALKQRLDEIETFIKNTKASNMNEKEKLKIEQDVAKVEIIKFDQSNMSCQYKIQSKTADIKTISKRIEAAMIGLGEKPKIIRDLESILKDRKVAIEFKQRIKEMSSKETLEQNISRLESKKVNLQTLKEKFEVSLKETKSIYEKRILKKEEIKFKNTNEAIESFKEYTSRSGYEGIMEIDHENKILDLKMKVHNSSVVGSKTTLSGGEKSFASICFLLSMWKCFKCPVKVLDEFDVFMDSVNRKNSIRSLLEFFKENMIQVILITPLDTSDLEHPDVDIKILRKPENL